MTSRDIYTTLVCLYREARGESQEAKRGVYHVIMNRVADSRWPNTPHEVIIQPKQFSSFNANDINYNKFPYPDVLSLVACAAIIDEPGEDLTLGANHYHSYPEGHLNWPTWATPETFTVKLGHLSFYKR